MRIYLLHLSILSIYTQIIISVTVRKFKYLAVKAIGVGGSKVKKICQAYFVEVIAVVSTLFTECQNSTWFR